MRSNLWFIRTFLICLSWAAFTLAVSASQVVLQLRNGDQVSGTVVRENDTHLTLRNTFAGRVRIPKSEIKSRETPEEVASRLKKEKEEAQKLASELAEAQALLAQAARDRAPDLAKSDPSSDATKADSEAETEKETDSTADPSSGVARSDEPESDAGKAPPEISELTKTASTASTASTAPPAKDPTESPPDSKPMELASRGKWYLPSTYAPEFMRPFLTNWSGSLGAGTDFGIGTRDRQSFNANLRAFHIYDRMRNDIAYNATYGVVNGVKAANRMEGSLKTDVDLYKKRRLYAWNQVFSGYDYARRIDHRFEESAGMGYKVVDRPRLIVSVEAGMQYQYFDYSHTESRDIYSGRLSQNLTWKPNDKLTVNQTMTLLQNVQDYDEFRLRFTLNATYPLYKKLSFTLNIIHEYETDPRLGVDSNDLQIQTSFGLRFP